jgi:hypothetical protein
MNVVQFDKDGERIPRDRLKFKFNLIEVNRLVLPRKKSGESDVMNLCLDRNSYLRIPENLCE